jgi:outer membrane protein assembly factor BamB
MLRVLRRVFTLALVLSAGAATAADLPDTRKLEQLGLVNEWWGRAVVDPTQDTIEYLLPDERAVVAQTTQGLLTTFRADTGRALWSTSAGGPGKRAFAVVTNEEVVVLPVGINMFAFDKFNGELRWHLKLPHHPSCPAELDDKQVYIGTSDGSVYAYDVARIEELYEQRKLPGYTHLAQVWRYKTPLDIISIISDGTSVNFASRIGALYGVEAKRRALLFEVETSEPIDSAIGRGGDAVYLASRDARMVCMNLDNGKIRWGFTSGTPIVTRPRVIGTQVFITPTRVGMYCLDTRDGTQLWHQPLASEFMAASQGRVYSSDSQGGLLALDRATGDVVGRIPMREFSIRSANELTDRVFMATTDGLVACFREQGQSTPLYHRYPERRPILPDLAPDDGAAPAAEPAEPVEPAEPGTN